MQTHAKGSVGYAKVQLQLAVRTIRTRSCVEKETIGCGIGKVGHLAKS